MRARVRSKASCILRGTTRERKTRRAPQAREGPFHARNTQYYKRTKIKASPPSVRGPAPRPRARHTVLQENGKPPRRASVRSKATCVLHSTTRERKLKRAPQTREGPFPGHVRTTVHTTRERKSQGELFNRARSKATCVLRSSTTRERKIKASPPKRARVRSKATCVLHSIARERKSSPQARVVLQENENQGEPPTREGPFQGRVRTTQYYKRTKIKASPPKRARVRSKATCVLRSSTRGRKTRAPQARDSPYPYLVLQENESVKASLSSARGSVHVRTI